MKLLLCLPVFLALGPVLADSVRRRCESCCDIHTSSPTAEDSDTLSCIFVTEKLRSITVAMESTMCSTGSEVVDEETCNKVATKAIPPCMLQEDIASKEACLQRTAKAITKEVGPIMKDCRCQAFNKIKGDLIFTSELVCAERDQKQHIDSNSDDSIWSLISNFQWLRDDTFSGSHWNGLLPGTICGYYEDLSLSRQDGRIVGGTKVDGIRQFPWQMSLTFPGSTQHKCGAALLSEFWVLTAAQCLPDMSDETSFVLGGSLDIDNMDKFEVEDYLIHEDFNPELFEQDIALLRLATPIVYSASLLPVCLPEPTFSRREDFELNLGRMATMTGRGIVGLEMVQLPIISNEMCMDWYQRSGMRQIIPESTFLCAGWEDGKKDACDGDGGGPLVVTRADGRAEVIGVNSWGIGCGDKGRPGVYTRVSQFVPWIRKTIRDYEENLWGF